MHVLCHTKGNEEKFFQNKQRYDKEREKEKTNVTEEINYDDFIFGYDALTCKNIRTNKKIEKIFVAD